MTSGRKFRRKPLVNGSVGVALLLTYFFGVFGSGPRGYIQADDVCANLPDKQAAADFFNSAVPSANNYEFHETSTRELDYYYVINCAVMDDHKKWLIDLTAEMVATIPSNRWEVGLLPPTTGGKITYFEAGVRGVSAPQRAGIFVPCYASDRLNKDQGDSLNVFAVALEPSQSSDKKIRQQLVDQALGLAKYAHKQAQCDLPSRLPGEVTAASE